MAWASAIQPVYLSGLLSSQQFTWSSFRCLPAIPSLSCCLLLLLLLVSVHVLVFSCARVYLSVHASCIQKSCCPAPAKFFHLRNHNAEGAVDHLQAPNFNSLSGVSLAAAFMSLSYSTIAFAGSINVGKQPGVEYNLNGYSKAQGIFGVFNALGTVAFAYGGHNVILEIQVGASVSASSQLIKTAAPVLCHVWTLADLPDLHCKLVGL